MENEEVKELKQKIFICVIVFIFIMVIGFVFIFNRFGSDTSEIQRRIRNRENFVVVFFAEEDSNSTMILDMLDEKKIPYYDIDKASSTFSSVLKLLDVTYEVRVPAIYVVSEGKVLYNITNVSQEEEVENFLTLNDVESLLEEE